MAGGWSRFALRFSEYYDSISPDSIWTPPRLRNREWMFIPWGGAPPDRHRAFPDKTSLHSYLRTRAPHSCFHSTAYYEDPSKGKMAEKGWLGADLIFDLDGDHLPGVSDNDFPAMIDVIQGQAWRLWNEFLEPEFGFKQKYAQFTFSGHRGFHIHLRDPSLLHLDSNARREMVNYIRGEGIDIQSTINADSGWGKRAIEGIDSTLGQLSQISSGKEGKTHTLNQLHEIIKTRSKSPNVNVKSSSKASIAELAQLADVSDEFGLDRISRLKDDPSLEVFGKHTPLFWELVKGDSSVVIGTAGETDEVVTIDTKRVIRWVGSLHGKSGLKVTELPLNRLDPDSSNCFDPLKEAVVFTGGSVKVRILADDVCASISGEQIEPSLGDELLVKESMAMFLCLKGWAEICK
jgi:DNA primase small subunit